MPRSFRSLGNMHPKIYKVETNARIYSNFILKRARFATSHKMAVDAHRFVNFILALSKKNHHWLDFFCNYFYLDVIFSPYATHYRFKTTSRLSYCYSANMGIIN